MKTFLISTASLLTAFLLVTNPARAAHVYAGIIDTDGSGNLGLGDALSFVSSTTGSIATGPAQGIQSMIQVTIGAQAGLYRTSNLSFTALSNGLNWVPATAPATGGNYRAVNPFAAKSGALLQLQIVSVTGPAGGTFGFWDEAVSLTNPSISYTVGSSGATAYWNLTDLTLTVGDGFMPNPTGVNNPAVDPYGHIHGRSFTADLPGEYVVSYVLHDANGLQADSAPFVVSYSAVPEPGSLLLLGLGGLVAFVFLRRGSVKKASLVKVMAAVLALNALSAQAHQHFDAGIVDENHNNQPDAGEALRLVNAPGGDAVFHFYPKATGLPYGGYYALDDTPRPLFPNDYFTFTAISSGDVDIAAPFHAAAGSSIWIEITAVTGPAGGSLGFWDENWSLTHPTPTQSFLAGDATGDFAFILSESGYPPTAGEDPQGHIHNRGWTVSAPGDYFVTFRLVDRSTNGAGGGPIHDPSELYTFHFVAVPEPGTCGLLALAAIGSAGWIFGKRSQRRF